MTGNIPIKWNNSALAFIIPLVKGVEYVNVSINSSSKMNSIGDTKGW